MCSVRTTLQEGFTRDWAVGLGIEVRSQHSPDCSQSTSASGCSIAPHRDRWHNTATSYPS